MKKSFFTFCLCIGIFFCPLKTAVATPPDIIITSIDGTRIPLVPEHTSGIAALPLVKTRERLNDKFKKEFLFLYKIKIADGASIIGRYKVENRSLRLTIYEITKKQNASRRLRVITTRFRQRGEIAEFKTVVKKFDEHIYLVTAEAVKSETQLNPHLHYMNSQNNEIILKGFSSNWNFSSLRFHLSGKDETEKKEVEFTKDADWLVSNLINPQWVVSIRLE